MYKKLVGGITDCINKYEFRKIFLKNELISEHFNYVMKSSDYYYVSFEHDFRFIENESNVYLYYGNETVYSIKINGQNYDNVEYNSLNINQKDMFSFI